MNILPWAAIVFIMCILNFSLLIKCYYLKKSANEIKDAFSSRLADETNQLITISSHDPDIQGLASAINEQLRILRTKRHRFEQGDTELKETITNISHDLRTPLTAIYGYLELLKRESHSEASLRYLSIIEERLNALKHLTEELFHYSVVTTSGNVIREEVCLNDVLAESISGYYAALKGCGIFPKISIPENPVIRSLNKPALSRIFGNILSNAVKYSSGDLKITLSENGELLFANHAPDLDEVQTARMFDRFYTVETAKNSTGLGLSIARSLTKQLGGKIYADYQNNMICIHLKF